jgi:hypothetical protein
MAAIGYVSLTCVNPWCGRQFIRPLAQHKTTHACTTCGKPGTAARAAAVHERQPMIAASPGALSQADWIDQRVQALLGGAR